MGALQCDIFLAAVNGDVSVLNETKSDDELLNVTTPDVGDTVLHIAVRYEHTAFIRHTMIMFPNLLKQKNNKENTPLHEAAALIAIDEDNIIVQDLLNFISSNADMGHLVKEVNKEGDTPFHVALRCGNIKAAEKLFGYVKERYIEIFLLKTKFEKETPLHLYVRQCTCWNYPQKIEGDNNGNNSSEINLLSQLIKANAWAMFELDSEGFNPLMRASQYGCVLLVLGMVSMYPTSMKCRDSKGRCFLHHLRLQMCDLHTLIICKEILEVPTVVTLIFLRDQDGNTPLHLAILDRAFEIAQMILERCVKVSSTMNKELILNIKNTHGKTIFDLVTSRSDIPSTIINLVELASRGEYMYYKIGEAATKFDMDVFKTYANGIRYQDFTGKNILHIATEHLQKISPNECFPTQSNKTLFEYTNPPLYTMFIEEAIRKCPQLMYQKDCNGDTPLHIAARFFCGGELLSKSIDYWYDNRGTDYDMQDLKEPPWKVKNSRGHTPLHEAARTSCFKCLQALLCRKRLQFDGAPQEVNENGETALHLIARYMRQPYYRSVTHEYDISNFIEERGIDAYMRDIEGLTPILRAAQCGQIWLVIELGKKNKNSMYLRDYKGRNVWHYICTSGVDTVANELEGLIKSWEEASTITSLGSVNDVFSQDDDGNTPLHLAIMDQNFEVVQNLFRHIVKRTSSLPDVMELVKNKCNRDGKSIKNLITSGVGIPAKLKELLLQPPHSDLMDEKFYEAATKGDYNKIQLLCINTNKSQYEFRQARDGSNMIHIALRHHHILFLKEVIRYHSFHLIFMKDSKGDAPLHLAAGLPPDVALLFYKLCFNYWTVIKNNYNSKYLLHDRNFRTTDPPPWTVRNSKGNTFLHEAARLCNYQVIFSDELVNDIHIIIKELNDNGETVLHVIARYATNAAIKYLEKLSEEMQSFVYVQDLEGFTPVLRAVQYGRLGLARLLIQQCRHSFRIPDRTGRTVLHHLRALVVDFVDDVNDVLPVWNDFYKYCHLDDLRIAQNENGNTALHSAIIDGDFTKVKFLMEKCLQSKNKRELDIVNNEGHTVFDLVSSLQSNIPAMKELQPLVSRSYVKERELMDKIMDEELYKAAINGNIEIFEPITNEGPTNDEESKPPLLNKAYFCRQTPGGSSIVHIALRHGKANVEQFIETALEKYPILSMRPDSNGDTPLHLAAKWKTSVSLVKSLIEATKKLLAALDESKKAFHVEPWAVKNYKGSFPIHEALQTGNLEAADALLGCDNDAASRVNDLGDTPLHSLAKNGFSINDEQAEKFVKKLIGITKQAAYKRDNEGRTPLLSAAKSGRFQVVRAILKHEPQSAYLRDPRGRTFLHLLHFTGEDVDQSFASTFKKTAKELFTIAEADAQRLVQDYEGDTPLHYAIKNENSIAAIVFTQRCLESKDQAELGLLNKEGQTIPDLLALHDVPNEIIELMQKKLPEAVYLARSSYGIRKSEMKESANALSVVAALLATMTFAAAFQVPGGNGDDGSPILLSKVAFAIFSVANTSAMCSSMLCLFLLLWVMGIGKTHGSLKVLDISIILLRMSFYLTLLTFTTSVFVVSSEKSLWMGIFVCVLGSLTFLLTFKLPFKTVAKYGGNASTNIKDYIKFVKSKCKESINVGSNSQSSKRLERSVQLTREA